MGKVRRAKASLGSVKNLFRGPKKEKENCEHESLPKDVNQHETIFLKNHSENKKENKQIS